MFERYKVAPAAWCEGIALLTRPSEVTIWAIDAQQIVSGAAATRFGVAE